MAGTSYFGNRSSTNGDSPFFKLKSFPLLSRTNGQIITGSSQGQTGLPVFRSAVANNKFIFTSPGAIATVSLITIDSAGAASLVSSTSLPTHLTNATAVAYHLNTIDQCLYILLKNTTTTYRLIKMSDSAGTVTTIGSSFTPANPSRWPQDFQQGFGTKEGTMWVDGGGNISIYFAGYTHQLNRTTGAIVTQDNVVTIGGYNLINTGYLSVDNTIACSPLVVNNATSVSPVPSIVSFVSDNTGIIEHLRFYQEAIFSGRALYGADTTGVVLVDSDKIFLGGLTQAQDVYPFGYVYRADFDQFLLSVVDWYIGA